jgi:hypothetical protein
MKGLLFIPELAIKACDGTKTQTRRALGNFEGLELTPSVVADLLAQCDYQTGERRALLAAWAVAPEFDHLKPTELNPNRVSGQFWHAGMGAKPEGFGKTRTGRFVPNVLRGLMMPMLDIQAVRIERVQDITEADAKAEGVKPTIFDPSKFGEKIAILPRPDSEYGWMEAATYRQGFQFVWDSINAKRGYGWNFNPVVSVIDFQPLKEAHA